MTSVWLALALWGASILAAHAWAPGAKAAPPLVWPPACPLPRSADRAQVVVLAHPRCPCTRTTLSELAALVPRLSADPEVWVLFERPPGLAPGWERGASWELALVVAGARAVADTDGSLTRLFGARTSGTVLVYDASGRLRFDGGITVARGHAGESDGARAIHAILGGAPGPTTAPVFGCVLAAAREGPP